MIAFIYTGKWVWEFICMFMFVYKNVNPLTYKLVRMHVYDIKNLILLVST